MKKLYCFLSIALFGHFACSSNNSDLNTKKVDVFGMYTITEATQHIYDTTGEKDETLTVVESDGVQLSVAQSGNILKFFYCMGPLEQVENEFQVECDGEEIVSSYGINQYIITKGCITFNPNTKTATGFISVDAFVAFPMETFEMFNDVSFVMRYEEEQTKQIKGEIPLTQEASAFMTKNINFNLQDVFQKINLKQWER